jgi:hypothetical protein
MHAYRSSLIRNLRKIIQPPLFENKSNSLSDPSLKPSAAKVGFIIIKQFIVKSNVRTFLILKLLFCG